MLLIRFLPEIITIRCMQIERREIMGTLIEEILSRKAGHDVHAGEIVLVDVDYIMSHDNTTPLAIKAFNEIGKPILDKDRIVIHLDHAYPRRMSWQPRTIKRLSSSLKNRVSRTCSSRVCVIR